MAIKIKLTLVLVTILFLILCILNMKNEYYEGSKFKVSLIERFLDKNEINTLLSDCNNFRNSTIISDDGNVISNFRTSKTCIIRKNSVSYNLILEKIKKLNLEKYNIEDLQMTKYNKGGFYKNHFDFFDHNKESENEIIKENGQRLKTIFVYLKKAELGGGTRFNKINKDFNLSNGDALYWDNCYKDRNGYIYEYESEHEGMPVLKGEKIGLNIWLTDK